MRDMMGMMKKAKEMQEKMASLQEEIAHLEVEGASGGGMVKITLNGQGQMVAIKLDPQIVTREETEILEDLIAAAHSDAKTRLEEAVGAKTQSLTAGLPLPPGFKFPF